jgi:hypothetical protein
LPGESEADDENDHQQRAAPDDRHDASVERPCGGRAGEE